MYIDKIQEVVDIMRPILNDSEVASMVSDFDQTKKMLKESAKVKLPIIGVFNAGKTTLVNSLLGADGSLPVNIVPETAIPCEIYPTKEGDVSNAEIYRGSQRIYNGDIAGYGRVDVEPGDFGMVYTTSPLIKEWSDRGIILVDMPGYDSGLEEHNSAIGRYMNQGTVFAFLMNCTHGSLRASELSILKEVCQYGLKIGVFLTWSDAQSAEKNEEVKSYVEYQTQSFLSKDTKVGKLAVLDDDNADFIDFVNGLDVISIISEKSKPIAQSFVSKQIANLKGVIALVQSGLDDTAINSKINDLSQRIHEMESLLKSRLEEADTPERSTQDVLDAAKMAIKMNASILADAILQSRGSGTISSVTETLISILRPALAKAFREEQEQFINTLKTDISELTRHILEGIDIPTDVLEEIIGNNEQAIVGYIHLLADMLQNHSHPVVKIIGNVLTFVAEYIPDILREFFGGKEKVHARLVENIQGPISDAIVSGLRKPVTEQIRALQAQILQTTCSQYEASINKMKETLATLYESKNSEQKNAEAEIAKYQEVINKIKGIYDGI